MCYFLYGGINEGINIKDFKKIQNDSFDFHVTTKDEFKKAVFKENHEYRITYNMCDCGSPIGKGKENLNSEELKYIKEMADYIYKFCDIRGIQYILISKSEACDEIEKEEETVHIQDIDLISYLANIEENRIYKIQLFKRYY